MDEKSLFTEFWSKESKSDDQGAGAHSGGLGLLPRSESRTAREIAWQIVGEEKMIIEALETGAVEWAPALLPATMKEVCDAYETQSAEIVRRWHALPAARWAARSTSSAVSGQPRRWRGAFCSTSCTTAAR